MVVTQREKAKSEKANEGTDTMGISEISRCRLIVPDVGSRQRTRVRTTTLHFFLSVATPSRFGVIVEGEGCMALLGLGVHGYGLAEETSSRRGSKLPTRAVALTVTETCSRDEVGDMSSTHLC